MRRNSHDANRSHELVLDSSENGPRGPMVITRHKLLTGSWTADVEALETAVGRFNADHPLTNDCQVVFFEIAGDEHLHVNVTHRYPTRPVRGWAGPASVPGGFIHNRTFGEAQPRQMIRRIRDVVLATRERRSRLPADTSSFGMTDTR
jgi:hypothetical protein